MALHTLGPPDPSCQRWVLSASLSRFLSSGSSRDLLCPATWFSTSYFLIPEHSSDPHETKLITCFSAQKIPPPGSLPWLPLPVGQDPLKPSYFHFLFNFYHSCKYPLCDHLINVFLPSKKKKNPKKQNPNHTLKPSQETPQRKPPQETPMLYKSIVRAETLFCF